MIDAKRYSRHDLQNGALDLRYNTKAELAGGELDSRYYTEAELNAGELDNRYYTETELDAGALDDRYYTEAEVAAILAFYASLYDPTQTIVADVLKALRLNLGGSDTPTRARLRIEGTDTSEANGPHAEVIGSADAYPLLHLLGWTHDNIALTFDGYYDSGWKASDATGFQVYKIADQLKIRRHTGSTPGGTATYIDVLVVDLTTGDVTIANDLISNALGLGSPTGSFRLEVHDDDATYLAKIRNVRGDSSGHGLWVDTRWNTSANIPFRVTSNQGNSEIIQANGIGSIGIGGSSYGGGNRVIYIANAITNPSSNPVGGGVLYSDSGSLKWRGPGGTTTTIAHSNGEWVGVPFATGWGHYGSYFTNGTYRKVGDTVTLRGLVTRSSGTSMVICTLPEGYRPSGGEVFTQRTSVGDLRVDVTSNGNVTIAGGSFAGTWVSLSGISFSTT